MLVTVDPPPAIELLTLPGAGRADPTVGKAGPAHPVGEPAQRPGGRGVGGHPNTVTEHRVAADPRVGGRPRRGRGGALACVKLPVAVGV